MRSDRDPPASEDAVVNLAPLAAACRELIGWYDQLIAGRQPQIKELDRIVTTLQLLPPVPGRVGRDIQLIIGGGGDKPDRDRVVGALERLRSIAGHIPAPTPDHAPSAAKPSKPARRPRHRHRKKSRAPAVNQDHLPGLEPRGDTATGEQPCHTS